DNEEPVEGITEDSSNTVKKIIAETPGAIGYLAFSYFDDSIEKLSIDDVEADDEHVISGEFEVWAYQHMYTKGQAEGLTQDFLEYMLSDEIQEHLVIDQGYIPVSKMTVERDASGVITDK